jgi:hypothetical protein
MKKPPLRIEEQQQPRNIQRCRNNFYRFRVKSSGQTVAKGFLWCHGISPCGMGFPSNLSGAPASGTLSLSQRTAPLCILYRTGPEADFSTPVHIPYAAF